MEQYEDIIANKCIYGSIHHDSPIDIATFINLYKSESLDYYIFCSDFTENIITTSFDQFKIIFDHFIAYTISVYGTVNIQDNKYGDTVFHTLILRYFQNYGSKYYNERKIRYEYMIKQLLIAGGDFDIKNNKGKTALDLYDERFYQVLNMEEFNACINSIFFPRKDAIEFIKSVSDTTGILYDVSNVVLSYVSIIRDYEHSNIVHDVYKSL